MKKKCFAALLFTMFLVVNVSGYIMCQESNELPIEDSNSAYYREDSNGIRYYARLQAHGDYTQLKLIVRSRKPDYNLGERVWLKFFVRNDSDNEIHVCCLSSPRSCVHFWKLFHSNYNEVTKTPKLNEEILKRQGRYGISWGGESGYRYQKLQPGQEVELHWMCLNDLFDLSKPDTYELTCFTTSVISGQEYHPPLQSNTLTFRVLETPVADGYWATGMASDGVTELKYQRGGESQHVPYTNPPPGEDVFKQPKPPKNVFYESSTGKILDVSPYTYYRERAKEQESQAAKPPEESKPPAE